MLLFWSVNAPQSSCVTKIYMSSKLQQHIHFQAAMKSAVWRQEHQPNSHYCNSSGSSVFFYVLPFTCCFILPYFLSPLLLMIWFIAALALVWAMDGEVCVTHSHVMCTAVMLPLTGRAPPLFHWTVVQSDPNVVLFTSSLSYVVTGRSMFDPWLTAHNLPWA